MAANVASSTGWERSTPSISAPTAAAVGMTFMLAMIVPAIDVDQLADQVTRLLAGEEHDDVRDVLGLGETTARIVFGKNRQPFFRIAEPRHRGVRDPGRDRVDPDAERRELTRHAAREPDDSELARHVRGRAHRATVRRP